MPNHRSKLPNVDTVSTETLVKGQLMSVDSWTKDNHQGKSHKAIAYGNGKFAAVGDGGEISAPDGGATWKADMMSGEQLQSVAYGDGVFVAVGGGAIVTSTDGDKPNWVTRTPGTTDSLTAIAFGNQRFVVAGPTGSVLTSTEGIKFPIHRSRTPEGDRP